MLSIGQSQANNDDDDDDIIAICNCWNPEGETENAKIGSPI